MKKIIYIFSVFSLLLSGWEYDNYEPPKSILSGSLVYENTPVGVRSGTDLIQIYEPGWQHFEPITVNVKQDGTFSSLLFEGDYKLVRVKGNGPWVDNTDTLDIQVRGGETSIEVPVEPFFMVRNEVFEVSGPTLTANFNIEKIVQDANIKTVKLYIGETMLIDNIDNDGVSSVNGGAVGDLNDPITLDIDLGAFTEDFVFARIGVETVGNSEFVFSQVQKIQL